MTNQTVFKPEETLGSTIDFGTVFGSGMVERVQEFKKTEPPMITGIVDGEPVPPGWQARTAGHHWLEKLDSDGHSSGVIVLQWNPSARRWSFSGNVGTGMYVNTKGWKYVERCPVPGETE